MAFRRPTSPTNTTYSGISNYKTDSYKPLKDKDIPAVPVLDSKRIARIHWNELNAFLASHLARETAGSRSSAREKLTRLTRQQFQELSTDVYDELVRRTSKTDLSHLPSRDDFHPKRNQARQKLSTLAKPRFKDLASDVFYELGRRYPEFKEPEILPETPGSTYDDFPSPSYDDAPPVPTPPVRKPSIDDDNYSPINRDNGTRSETSGKTLEPDRPYGLKRRNSGSDGESNYSPLTAKGDTNPYSLSGRARKISDAIAPSPSTATSGVIIPNISTMAEEEIQVPYGRDDSRDSNVGPSEPRLSTGSDPELDAATPSPYSADGFGASKWNPTTPLVPVGGLNALGKKLNSPDSDEEDDRDRKAVRGGVDAEEVRRLKEDYESQLKSLQNRITSLESEVENHTKARRSEEERMRNLNEDLRSARNRIEDSEVALRAAQRSLDEVKASQTQDRAKENRRQAEQEEEIQRLQQKCEKLEGERSFARDSAETSEAVDQLRLDMQNLLTELTDLSSRNEELLAEKQNDMDIIRDLERQVADYRSKYEKAKTQLRTIKATSSLFLQPLKSHDQMPVAKNGVIQDTHITAFQSAADSLLTAGRSNAPSTVLTHMKAVINAVSSIVEDARGLDPQSRDDIDMETVQTLCDRVEATLSNLVTASRTHATSYGLSPVSLLDAAMSHVSASITELTTLLFVRRSGGLGNDLQTSNLSKSSLSPASATTMRSPASRPLGPSGWRDEDDYIPGRPRGMSDGSSSGASPTPPTVFDPPSARSGGMSDISTPTEVQEEEGSWDEIRPYVQTQSDQVIQAIQSVLSAVRSPAPPPELAENVTQIITLVSSIVAVSKDSLPPYARQKGQVLLDQLSDQCNKLSLIQVNPSNITKEARQQMAQSSFSIANAVKELKQL